MERPLIQNDTSKSAVSFLLRHIFPISYFQATRLNRWSLVGYNGLVEWIPALVLSYYFNDCSIRILPVVVLSYLAFICVYEIGYITNDFFSEKFESNPRGRRIYLSYSSSIISVIILSRIAFFLLFTFLLGATKNPFWWAFYGLLTIAFALHNLLPNRLRTATFFALSTYRYFAPIILSLAPPVITILLPTILLNNSLYRTTVYLRNKNASESESEQKATRNLGFYVGAMPLSALLSIYFSSLLPIIICIYYLLLWSAYWLLSGILKRRSKDRLARISVNSGKD